MDSTTNTSISLSWTSAGSVVDYEVMWQRDTSGECSDEDEGNTTITDGPTSYNVTGLEEDSNYTVTVLAINSIGNANSNTVTGMTVEAGKKIDTKQYNYIMYITILYSRYCCSYICGNIVKHIFQHHCPVGPSKLYRTQWRHNRLLSAVWGTGECCGRQDC